MLSRFSVTNYMGFPEKITWDLSQPHEYAFNPNLIHNGIVKNGIISKEKAFEVSNDRTTLTSLLNGR